MRTIKRLYYNIKNGITNLIHWFPIIWQDRNWDDIYIYILLHKKLELMEKFYKSDECFSTKANKEIAQQLKIAKLLCQRIIKSDYLENALIPFYKKYGEVKLFEFEKDEEKPYYRYKNLLDVEQNKMWNRASKHSDYMEKQDKDYFFRHIRKYIDRWWD